MACAKVLGQDLTQLLQVQQGGLCSWSRVGEVTGRRGEEGAGCVMQDLGGPQGGFKFLSRVRWEPGRGVGVGVLTGALQ